MLLMVLLMLPRVLLVLLVVLLVGPRVVLLAQPPALLLLVLVVLTGVDVHVELGADGAQDEAAGRTEHQRGEEDSCRESSWFCQASTQSDRSRKKKL